MDCFMDLKVLIMGYCYYCLCTA